MTSPPSDPVRPPSEARRRALTRVWAALRGCRHVVLTTHVNADGDGAGSEAAVAHVLRRMGAEPAIVNPTPFPESYRFLLDDLPASTPAEPSGRAALDRAELLLVLDTAEPSRIGALAGELERRRVAVLDHHPPGGLALGDPSVRDAAACATGELVYDLLVGAEVELRLPEARGIYVAVATDTGSFRFSNTTPRAHAIAAHCIETGVDPEAMYGRLFAQYTPEGLELLRRALGTLRTDPALPISWIHLRRVDVEASGAGPEDADGIVEFARRLRGTEVAILFRELHDGRTKTSLRSNGPTDVAAVASAFGGGGHTKAAGAVLERPPEEAEREVLAQVRAVLRPRPPA